MRWTHLSLGLCLAVSACSSSTRQATLARIDIGTKYARQQGYFAACGAGCVEEKTRGGIRHDAILDEVVLAKIDARETCFDLTVRTEESKDEPFTQLNAQCEIDGVAQRAAIESEVVSVFDHSYVGQHSVAVVEGVAMAQYIGMEVTRPAEKVFRVIDRRGTVCCARPAAATARLRLRNTHLDVGVSKGLLDMVWKLSG